MKGKQTGIGTTGLLILVFIGSISAAALCLNQRALTEEVHSAGCTFILPIDTEVSRTLLSDGRIFEVHGAERLAYIVDGRRRTLIHLPEVRRFSSVTVMPGGQVLLWGGVDADGWLLRVGEWFDPTTARFVTTGVVPLPPRAGHTLTVLTDGSLLMTGGWTANGEIADDVLFDVTLHITSRWSQAPENQRIGGLAQLEANGSVRVTGGVDRQGHVVNTVWRYNPRAEVSTVTNSGSSSAGNATYVAATSPVADSKNASVQGPLTVRFVAPVDVRSLNEKSLTLLGPEGAVRVRVFGVEGGRLAFVQLPDELYPGSRYTLFLKGLRTATGDVVPYTVVGFTTAAITTEKMSIAGEGNRRSAPVKDLGSALPPLFLMAGRGKTSCADPTSFELCRPKSFMRDGAWYPGQNNAPNGTGGHWRLYTTYQRVPDGHLLIADVPKSSTVLIGQVRQIDEQPIANVEISVGDNKVRTDARGMFVLKHLSAGRKEMFVNGGTASHGDIHYGRFLVGADIKAHVINRMPFVMYLPRVLPRDEIQLPSPTNRELVLTHPDMPGLELHIPAGTVLKDHFGHVLNHIAIVPTPVDHAPFPLPDNFPMYFTIQPGDAVVQGLTPIAAKGIRVVYPNYGHAKAQTTGNFWVYDAKLGWKMYGGGRVAADAKHLVPDPGVSLVWAMGAGASLGNANGSNSKKPGNKCKGQPVDLQTGIMFHEWNDMSINDIMPLTVMRAYNSEDNKSHAFGVGGSSNFGIHLYSSDGTFTQPQLVLPCGEGIVFNLVTGSPSWSLNSSVYEHTGTNSAFYGARLQHMSPGASEWWQVTMKDGTAYGFQSDVPNNLLWIQDRYGNQVTFNYNGGLLDQMVSPSGRSISFSYDSGNRIISAVDNTGRTINYAYNTGGSLSKVTYPDNTTEQYTYDATDRMLTMQDRRGNTWVRNQYDANGRVIKQTYADNSSYQFGYTTDSSNNVTATTVTDPNGNQEYVTFDPSSHYTSSDTYAYGTSLAQTTTYLRETSGLVDSETDAMGRTTSYTYDALGNVLKVTKLSGTPNAVTTAFTYTPDYNQLASVTDPLGHTTTFSYNQGCLTQITDPLGHSTSIQCNAVGQPTSIKNPLGNTTTFTYQGYDLQSVTDPLGRSTSYVVDALGRRIATRDPTGNVTLTTYDSIDRAVSVTDALNQTTSLSYDGNGNLLAATLPNAGVINYAYDARNRKIMRFDAMNQKDSWTYDGMGNVLTHTDRKGQVTDVSYDALNRRSLVSYADGSGIQATYDAGNRLISLADSSSGTLSWAYDGLDRVQATSSPQGTVNYTYDAAGRRLSMTPASQATANYTYDDANRLTGITQGNEIVQMAYDVANRRTLLTLPNGVTVNYGYDDANELTSLAYAQGNGTSLGNLIYGYDGDGRITNKTGTFATDAAPTPTTQAATFDLNDRETSLNGQALSYDANGNLIFDGINTYTWNARNQLSQISQNGNAQLSFTYDALGRRISKTTRGTATQFLYDGNNAVQETQGSNINAILTGSRVDERFARSDVTGRTYFLNDALNSTIALTDSTGAIKEQYSYDPYGNVTPSDITTGFTNPYQYTGREADTAGLYYYRARYYSPMMGGFISEDPIGFRGGQLSFYAYVGGNPINNTDPMGLACNGNGCWTTAGERAYLNNGDYMGYYQAACSDGDQDACFDAGVAGNTGWAGEAANKWLRYQIKKYDPCGDLESIMEQIREDLANDYANYLPSSESDARWPDASDIAQYHWAEFAKFGLPPSTFGGTPFGQSVILAQQLWCPECQLPPAPPAPILP